ncbi:chemotaxis protein CheB [Clostridium vincentii]|uniref:protein-glutamate methylesterase n=1 Tax=Clostridium vincentii TaxID=52704 RepID=A0A2T0BIQ6_9CLOT|nr:chemotaxis protein CheB [Clostridium vincentii]PRR83778.1 Chemotaxis response regulator protein-glutamate methylesterase [Clostridium vincentii]
MKYKAIVIGTSTGGMEALRSILSTLQGDFSIPVIIVQHLNIHSESYLIEYLRRFCKLRIKEVEDKEVAVSGYVYFAPPNYHILIEKDGSFTLSVEERVCYARPSIDVLFETAADTFEENLIGVILTGANKDGSYGLSKVKEQGGIAIVQEPETSEADRMPKSAIESTNVDYILKLEEIGELLIRLQCD